MKRALKRWTPATRWGCLLAIAMWHSSASGFAEFSREFKAKYVGDQQQPAQQALAALAAQVKCNVCHDPRKNAQGVASKKNRNAYGQAIDELLSKADKKNAAKIQKALEKVEAKKAAGATLTFGELLEAGKLPVAPPPTNR